MQNTLAPWTGDAFPMPTAHPQPPAPPTGRTRRWSIELGRGGLAICSTVEDHRPRVVASPSTRPTLGLMMAAAAGGFALLLAGASAGRAWSSAPPPTEAAMIIPAAKPVARNAAAVRPVYEGRGTIGRAFPAALPPAPADDAPGTPIGLSKPEAIARALGTGEFQEWVARDGTTGFAVAGPAEATPQGNCRALAVLTRKIDGSDSVASSRECVAAPEPAAAKD